MRGIVFTGILLCLLPVLTRAQMGKDGAKTISSANQVLNEYTTLTADAAAGSTSISVAASGLNANNRFGYTLSPGDLILIIQMQGASIDFGSWWWNFGFINNYLTSGTNELAEVLSVPNATSINLSCPLSGTYSAAGKTQIVRVPRLTDLTVNNAASISCDPWNGASGGVVALEVSGTATIASGGSIVATGLGFRGGVNTDMNSSTGVGIYASTNEWDGTEKGEGIGGSVLDYDLIGGRYSKNAAANGGGGGNAHNGGGGGGANGTFLNIWNGKGNPDSSTAAYRQAWDLESANFHHNQSDGGGRGGYTYSWINMDATITAPGDVAWGGDYRRNEGGQGGRTLDYSNGRLFIGGGGGAGDQGPDTDFGGDGGNGGGLIYLQCYGSVIGSGSIVSNGNHGGDAQGTPSWNGHAGIDGGGGGGGGGTIVIKAPSIANTLSLTANGGDGGDQIKTKSIIAVSNGEAEGPGGGGGGGHIAISAGSPSRTVNGGINGISYAQTSADNGVEEFPPNGATRGGIGNATAIADFFYITATGDSICSGDTAHLSASLNGTPPSGATINWYDAEVGGNLLGSGPNISLPGITDTTLIYVGSCPGTYREAVVVIVYPSTAEAGPDLYLCNATSDTLHASGGLTYSWTPSAPLNNPAIPDPIVTLASTTEFFLTTMNSYGCTGVDSVTVFVNTLVATVTSDTAICNGSSITLTAGGGNTYAWSTGDSTAGITVSPGSTQSYTVTAAAGACNDTATVLVTVNPLPNVNIGPDVSFCQGASLVLDAANAGSTYHWQDNSTLQTLSISATGTYAVTVTDPLGCSAADTMALTVVDWADATIDPVQPLCANVAAFDLTAADPGGTWSGTGITNAAAGTFNPALSGPGSFVVSYGIAGMCGDTAQSTIQVYALPVITLVAQTESCTGNNDASITATVSGGTVPYTYLWSSGQDTTVLTMLSPGLYTLSVSDSHSCTVTSSQLLTGSDYPCYTPHIYIPNIFSPNGDGVNDLFQVRGAGVISFQLIIYDRWGEKVFESDNMEDPWDGTFRGKDCESAVYFYSVKVIFETDESLKRSGNISLVR